MPWDRRFPAFALEGLPGNCATGRCTIVGVMGCSPTGSALCSAWQKFVASLSQIPPIGPVLPALPVYKSFAVYILAWDSFHGMEEVIGSIPIRSTKQPLTNQ
jgi:hypothetical protein